MSAQADERWLDLPGGRFRALEWAGAEPGVLFLHGLTGVAEAWQETVDALGDDRPRCVAIDQRGHGASVHGGPYHVRQLVQDALAAASAASLERPHLVGHSMGARVAMAAASWHPEAWRSVVERFDVADEVARRDVERFLSRLRELGLVRTAEE